MLLAVAGGYLRRTCCIPRSSFVTFLVQAKDLHKRVPALLPGGLPVTNTPCFKHLSLLFSFCFLLGCISVSYVSSSFGELLCCPRCWRVQLFLVGGGGGVKLPVPLGTVLLAAVALWPDMLSTWLFARRHYSHGLIGLGSFAPGTKSCALVSTELLGVFEMAIRGTAFLQAIRWLSALGPYAVSLPDVLLSMSKFLFLCRR
jgi:hypothetical protein